MQLPIFPPVGPTSGEGPERSKPSGEASPSHKQSDGFLRVFGGMRPDTLGTPGTSKKNELGSDPAIGPRLFADREASGSIRAPDDPAVSPGANPENSSVTPQSPTSTDLSRSATHTPWDAGAEGAEPEPIASVRQGLGAQGLRAFRPVSFAPDPLENAAKPDSKFDSGHNSVFVSGLGLGSGTDPAGAAKVEHRETDKLQRNATFSDSTAATIPTPTEAQESNDSHSDAVATMGVVRPLEQGHEIDNASAIFSDSEQKTIGQGQAVRPEPFVPDPLKNAPEPDSKFDPEPNSALVSGHGLESATDPAGVAKVENRDIEKLPRYVDFFTSTTATTAPATEAANRGEAGSGAEVATRVTRPLTQSDSVKIAAATVSGDERETTERKQAPGPSALVAGASELPISGQGASNRTKAKNRGPSAALSHNVALGMPANSAAPTGAAAALRTGEAGPQRPDRAASSVGGKTDSGHKEAPATASPSGSKSAPGRVPLEKSLPLPTGPMDDRFVDSKGTKSGPVAAEPKNLNGAQRVTASPEARGGSAQVANLDIQMPRSDQGAEISMTPKGKRSVGAASLSTAPLAPPPSGPAPSLPDGYAQMRGVGVEKKAERTPANLEPSAHSGGQTSNVVQISGPQAPGGIAAQSGASGTAASPLPFTVLVAEPSDMEKRRTLEPEAALADVRGASVPTTSTGSTPPLTPHHETARAVMAQLAHSVRANADRAIELRLHPEELGHVKMTFSTDHGGLSVALTADRSETLDLLRRNIDMLGEELRRIGYGSVDFSFGGDSHQRGGEAEPWPSDEVSGLGPETAPDHDHTEETKARAIRGLAPTHGGVDMRI